MASDLWPTLITAGSALIGVALGTGLNQWGDRVKWEREHRHQAARERMQRLEEILIAVEEVKQLATEAAAVDYADAGSFREQLEVLLGQIRRHVARVQLTEPDEVAVAAVPIVEAVVETIELATETMSPRTAFRRLDAATAALRQTARRHLGNGRSAS